LEFTTLEHTGPGHLLETFNQSFKNYFVPMQLTREQLEQKIVTDNVDLRLSAGAFENKKLVAFILHGKELINGVPIVYNSGTGVLAEARGAGLSQKLYDFVLPALHEIKTHKCVLEVIESNQPAIRTYNKIGFNITRQLECYKGAVKFSAPGEQNDIYELNRLDWPVLKSFWDWSPTWQNRPGAIEKMTGIKIIGIRTSGQLAGYAIFSEATGRIHQFAVSKFHRRKGLGSRLFEYIGKTTGKGLSTINVDSKAHTTLMFLESVGLNPFIRQFEMELTLNPPE
jgi:ribosomal protein S18 acetylase RimI-like enzyme